jgi:hypothetical protein
MITARARLTMVRPAAARWRLPRGYDGCVSSRGVSGRHRARGGGGGAHRAAARSEVVKAGGDGTPVVRGRSYITEDE